MDHKKTDNFFLKLVDNGVNICSGPLKQYFNDWSASASHCGSFPICIGVSKIREGPSVCSRKKMKGNYYLGNKISNTAILRSCLAKKDRESVGSNKKFFIQGLT